MERKKDMMVELKLYQSVVCCLCVSRVFKLAGGAACDANVKYKLDGADFEDGLDLLVSSELRWVRGHGIMGTDLHRGIATQSDTGVIVEDLCIGLV